MVNIIRTGFVYTATDGLVELGTRSSDVLIYERQLHEVLSLSPSRVGDSRPGPCKQIGTKHEEPHESSRNLG